MAQVLISSSLMMAASSGTAVHAAAWSMSEQASVGGGYDDNVLLSPFNSIRAADVSASASLHLERRSDALAFSLDPRVVAVRYDGYSALNRTEEYLSVVGQRQYERGNSSLALNWTRDTTLTSEAGSTGITTVNKPHDGLSATWSTTYQWSERWDNSTQLYASRNRYLDAGNTGLVNYSYGAAQLGVDYALTQESQLSLLGVASELQVPDFGSLDKTSMSAMLSYSAALAQRWHFKASFGPSRVRSDFSAEQGTVYEVSLVRQSLISNIQLGISRDITPTGQGVLTRREQLNLTLSKQLTERIDLIVRASWVTNNSILSANSFAFDRVRYSDAAVSVNWRVAPTWTVSLSGGHTEQLSEGIDRYATRNQCSLSVTWAGLAHSPRHLMH